MGRISNRLEELMEEKRKQPGFEDLNLQRLAYETKLAYTTVHKWVRKSVDRYDAETLATFCEYFNVQPGDILIYTEN